MVILCLFHASAHAEAWTDEEITLLQERLDKVYLALIEQLNDLEKIKNFSESEVARLEWINGNLSSIKDTMISLNITTQDIQSKIYDITEQLTTLNSEIMDIYNTLEQNQQELLSALDEDNKQVLEELNMIRDSINGSEEEEVTFNDLGTIVPSVSASDWKLKCISLNYETRYTYTVTVTYRNYYDGVIYTTAYFNDNLLPSGFNPSDYSFKSSKLGDVPPNSSGYVFTFDVPSSNPNYIYLSWGYLIQDIKVTRKILGIAEIINKNNETQQENNQLQQEQNNFLKQDTSDSDVSIDGFSNIDSNDITSSGLTGIFNTIYNSISSWNSKDISLPVPFTNKSILIPANSVESALQRSGATWVLNLIHAVYYFIVSRFMIYSITNIVNSIKGGNILNTGGSNNITTDML